jgi:hypothetical protein
LRARARGVIKDHHRVEESKRPGASAELPTTEHYSGERLGAMMRTFSNRKEFFHSLVKHHALYTYGLFPRRCHRREY